MSVINIPPDNIDWQQDSGCIYNECHEFRPAHNERSEEVKKHQIATLVCGNVGHLRGGHQSQHQGQDVVPCPLQRAQRDLSRIVVLCVVNVAIGRPRKIQP